jgi:SagB-type dehydrogenase family enzyme
MIDHEASNRKIGIARRYHQGSKHPRGELFDLNHDYDPSREPRGNKSYPDAKSIELPEVAPKTQAPALRAITMQAELPRANRTPDLGTVARLLHYTGGITQRLRFPGRVRRMPFRAAACTGALYHIELYLVCGGLLELPAGVYHYNPEQNQLSVLREGDHRQRLISACGGSVDTRDAPAFVVFSDAYWRNAYKYQAREYRHAFWDGGTMAANTLAMSSALGLEAELLLGFADRAVAELLGLEGQPEFPLFLIPIGAAGEPAPAPPELGDTPNPAPDGEGYRSSYPAITEMAEASGLESGEDARHWRNQNLTIPLPQPQGDWHPLETGALSAADDEPVEAVIRRRGSSRKYQRSAIPFEMLSVCLRAASAPAPFDCLDSPLSINHTYLIVNAVEGLSPGAYVFHPDRKGLERLRSGDFRMHAGRLALGQALAADASAAIFFTTDLDRVLEAFGNRGYRAAQLEASLAAGRIYLAAYAQHIGATGLTFVDDPVTDFFSPHAQGKSVMFLITVGNPA